MSRERAATHTDYIIKEYNSGRSSDDIGRELGFSAPTIATILKLSGVVMRGNVHRLDPEPIITRFKAGESAAAIAKSLAVTQKVVARILTSHGYSVSTVLKSLPQDELLRLFHTGTGVAGIAKHFNTAPSVVLRHLESAGVKPRNRTEQQLARMANATPEQIQHLTAAAHKAATGRKRSIRERAKGAETRYRNGSQRVSAYETQLVEMLRAAGLTCDQQTPIGPYNCDITTGAVAVEVWGGHWHFHGDHAARCEERFRYILNSGWHIVAIVISASHPLTSAVADHLIQTIKLLGSDPATRRQYRVIWGAGYKSTSGSINDDQITIKPTLHHSTDRTG